MPYHVVVVDDERIICTGISNIITSSIDDFSVAAQFADGREAIEYLKTNPVDVVLTDIKMTFSSGLDIAQYVFENKMNVKVVLLSGHQDFALARQAIKFGVRDYILKPTSITQLKEVFERIKKDLDEEKTAAYYQNEMLPSVQQYFLEELLLGMPDEKLINILRLLNVQWVGEKWAMVQLEVSPQLNSEEREHLRQTLTAVFSERGGLLHLTAIVPYSSLVFVLARIDQNSTEISLPLLDDLMTQGLKYLCLEQTPQIDSIRMFENFQDLVETLTEDKLKKWRDSQLQQVLDFSKIYEKITALVKVNNADALLDLYNTYLIGLPKDLAIIREYTSQFFSTVIIKLAEEKGFSFEKMLRATNLMTITAQATSQAIVDSAREEFKRLFNTPAFVVKEPENAERMMVRRAKEFIIQHCTQEVTLESVAKEFYLSPAYFSVLFKKEAGCNFVDFLAECKMKAAAQLLRASNQRVHEIARQVGYLSIKHFNKIFKEYFGCTPTEYRDKEHELL